MRDHPIIFSAPMVKALLDGRKTMTRRLAWKYGVTPPADWAVKPASPWQRVKSGARLWVREGFVPRYYDNGFPAYLADWSVADEDIIARPKFRPSIHMPRWASRLTLTVTAVKIEKLQDITHSDAVAEGIERLNTGRGYHDPTVSKAFVRMGAWFTDARDAFAKLWISLHGAEAWEANPEVVALTFTAAKQNIDAMKDAA